MMRVFIPTFLFSLLVVGSLYGQGLNTEPARDVQVMGMVVDGSTEQPLEFVAISVYRQSDSLLVDGTTSGLEGEFEFFLSPGSYYLVLNFIGYQAQVVEDIQVAPGTRKQDLGKVKLQELTTVLDEVEVVAERTQMELKLDKRVYNIGKDVSNIGGNAADVLDNLPSVQVDIEGNISLRGSEGVRILIDGKPSGLLGGGTDALRQLSGDLIERVEIITNPSARYEAEGEVGIINIVLKKEKEKGFNGSFGVTAGYPENFGANYGLNFRRNSLNFFSNFGLVYRDSPGGGNTFQRSEQGGETFILESELTRSRGGISGNFQFGTDWYITDQDILTASAIFQSSNGQNDWDYVFRDSDAQGNLIQVSERDTDERENSYDLETALSYRKLFDNEDQVWTVDFKYIHNDDTELASYFESSDTTSFILNQRSSNTEDEENFLFQTDYAQPLWDNSIAEFGARISSRRIDNDFTVEEQQENGEYEVIPQFDNYLIYLENIYAAYALFGSEAGPFSYQFGLRTEYTDLQTELVNTNEVNPRDFLNLFPSAFFSYKVSPAHQFQLSYSRRISRPRFRNLLPFYGFGNNRNIYAGNPDLNPEFAHSVESSYLHYFDKGSFLASLYYRYRTDVIDRILIPDGMGGSLRIPVNLATQHAFGIEGNVSIDFFPWWRNNLNFNFYRDITEGTFEGQDLFADNYSWTARWNGRFSLPGSFDLQMAFDYRAPEVSTQGRNLAIYALDAGITRDVFNGNGTIILSVRDMFNSRKWRGITDVPGFYREQEFQWRARQFLLTFNYRLNQNKRDTNLFRSQGGEG